MNIASKNVSFTGQFIAKTTVKKTNSLFPNKKVSIVELDPNNENDYNTLRSIRKNWRGSCFSANILKDADLIKNKVINPDVYKLYVVTKQKNNFKKISPDKVLAQAELGINKDSNNVWVEYLQVRPDCVYGEKDRPYKQVGTSFIDFCKDNFKGKNIVLFVGYHTDDFYTKQGFVSTDSDSNLVSYQA